MITYIVSVDENISELLAGVVSALTGGQAAELMEQGGIAARNAAIKYHRDFDQSGGWQGKRYLGPSAGRGARMGTSIIRSIRSDHRQ